MVHAICWYTRRNGVYGLTDGWTISSIVDILFLYFSGRVSGLDIPGAAGVIPISISLIGISDTLSFW